MKPRIPLCIFILIFCGIQLATAVDSYSYTTEWATNGTGDIAEIIPNYGPISGPAGIASDGVNNIYVIDHVNHEIRKHSLNGNFITKWGGEGTTDGKFAFPYGITIDKEGNVYVADTSNNRIQKFSASGSFMTKWGSQGSDDGQFNSPFGIAVDNAGYVYVADTDNLRVQKFSSSGTYISKWGWTGPGSGEIFEPSGIAVDSSGNVFVTDTSDQRVLKFSPQGQLLKKWGSKGTDFGEFLLPAHIAVDRSGNVYVSDRKGNRVQKFTSDGDYITQWGSEGSNKSQFRGPEGITVDNEDRVYVADSGNYRIQKFSSETTKMISTDDPTGSGGRTDYTLLLLVAGVVVAGVIVVVGKRRGLPRAILTKDPEPPTLGGENIRVVEPHPDPEGQYDIFISFKNLDESGKPTRDSILAREVYDRLSHQGFKLFFSQISLEEVGESAYQAAIDRALDSSRILIAVGTSAENLNARWVRYEWDSFFNDIRGGIKPNGRVFVYVERCDIKTLPRALRQTQVFNREDEGLEKLANFVGNALVARDT